MASSSGLSDILAIFGFDNLSILLSNFHGVAYAASVLRLKAHETLPMPPDLNLRISPRTVQRETVDKLRLAIFSGLF